MIKASSKTDSYQNQKIAYIELPGAGALPPEFYNYLTDTTSASIKAICSPLNEFEIDYFLFVRKYQDGTYTHITNNEIWQKFFYENHYYANSDFEDASKSYKSGQHLWIALNCQAIYQKMRELVNIHHGITFIQEFADCTEFYHFGSRNSNNTVNNFFLNNIEVFQRFNLYFKDKSALLLKQLANQRIKFPPRNTISHEEFIVSLKSEFIKQTPISRFYLPNANSDTYLTKREIECLEWYSKGKSSTEIAMILGMSKRTVEAHLQNLKVKMNCFNKAQISTQAQLLLGTIPLK